MNRHAERPRVGWRTPLLSIAVAVLTLNTGCSHSGSEQRLRFLEDQAKMLMISEAQQGFSEIFKAGFNPDKTRLLLGADMQRWFQDHRSQAPVPELVRTAIRNNQGAGLLIQGGLPGNKGGQQDVVYLRAPQFGFNRLFLKAEPDPCGDGNPAMCEYCSGGCTGDKGTGCYCTLGCGSCRVCPKC